MATQKEFLDRLGLLAQTCEFRLTPQLLSFYDRALQRFGYDKAVRAVEEAIMERRGNDKMPSIGDLAHRCAPVVTEQDNAVEAAGRILSAISKFGYARSADAHDWIGEVGWRVVEVNGGWTTLCQTVREKDVPTWKAQLREQCASAIRRHKAGVLELPPCFDELPHIKQIASLVGGVLNKGEKHAGTISEPNENNDRTRFAADGQDRRSTGQGPGRIQSRA